jgi:hypothetical protein
MLEWVIGIAAGSVGIILGLVAVIWRTHELHDRERNTDIWNQLGRSSKEGMRGVVHDSANRLSEVSLISHDHERRIDRIERVLNGKLRREDER